MIYSQHYVFTYGIIHTSVKQMCKTVSNQRDLKMNQQKQVTEHEKMSPQPGVEKAQMLIALLNEQILKQRAISTKDRNATTEAR